MIEENSEGNTARLIRAAYDSSAHPAVEAKERTFQLLLDQMRASPAADDFPELVVGLLGGMLAIAVAWLIARAAWGGAALSVDPALCTVGIWAIANLSGVPVAGIVILNRRKHG
jgi:hypothetical protein